MIRSRKLPKDTNQRALAVVRLATEEPQEQPTEKLNPISEYLATIGRKGGLKGGIARKKALSQKRRTEIARKAAKSRWNKGK